MTKSATPKKQIKEIGFKQDIILGVDFEAVINKILDWAYEIYDSLFFGKRTEVTQGKHLSSFVILSKIGRSLNELKIDLDIFSENDEIQSQNLESLESMGFNDTHKKQSKQASTIKQEYITSKVFGDFIDNLLSFMASKLNENTRYFGNWRPDGFVLGETQAYDEIILILDEALKKYEIKPKQTMRQRLELMMKSGI